MYKIFLLLILISLTGCFNNEAESKEIFNVRKLEKSTFGRLGVATTEQDERIELSLEKKTYKKVNKIILTIKNTGEREVTSDNSYQLEYLNGDDWFFIPVRKDIDFTMTGNILKPNTSSEIVIDFNNHTFNMKDGKYRIVKKIGKSSALAVPFYLKKLNKQKK